MEVSPTAQSLLKYKLLTFLFFGLAIATYEEFLDILIPGLPNGSYREAVGPLFFLIPTIVLAGFQIMSGGFVLYMTVRTLSHDNNRIRMWQALSLASVQTFLFSLTYAFFGRRGPLYYLVFVGGGPPWILPLEILWTTFQIISLGYLLERLTKIKWRWSLFTSAFILILILDPAS